MLLVKNSSPDGLRLAKNTKIISKKRKKINNRPTMSERGKSEDERHGKKNLGTLETKAAEGNRKGVVCTETK